MLDETRDHLTEGRCIECGVTYGYDAAWWRGRSLQPPRRCRLCRQARRGEQDAASTGTRPRVRGVVDLVHHARSFAFIALDDGTRAYASPYDFGVTGWPPTRGDVVECEIEPPPQPGRSPRARCVVRV